MQDGTGRCRLQRVILQFIKIHVAGNRIKPVNRREKTLVGIMQDKTELRLNQVRH